MHHHWELGICIKPDEICFFEDQDSKREVRSGYGRSVYGHAIWLSMIPSGYQRSMTGDPAMKQNVNLSSPCELFGSDYPKRWPYWWEICRTNMVWGTAPRSLVNSPYRIQNTDTRCICLHQQIFYISHLSPRSFLVQEFAKFWLGKIQFKVSFVLLCFSYKWGK